MQDSSFKFHLFSVPKVDRIFTLENLTVRDAFCQESFRSVGCGIICCLKPMDIEVSSMPMLKPLLFQVNDL